MKRIRRFSICSCLIAFSLVATMTRNSVAQVPKAMVIGTSSVGSTFYTISVGIADVLTRYSGINVTAEAVGGSDANARAIRDGRVEMAVLNSFAARNALLGEGTFQKGGPAPLRLVYQGHTSLRQILARPGAGIRSFADLKGKVLIGKRRSLAELELITKALLKAYGMTENDVKIVETSDTQGAIQALEVGSVDAAVFPGGVHDPNVTELMQRKVAEYVPLDDAKYTQALEELGPAFAKFTIPTTMYPNLVAPARAFKMNALLVAAEGVSQETVYMVAKTLADHYEDVKRIHKGAAAYSLENTVDEPPLPFHAGMVRLLKEKGLWTADLQARQEKLLKEIPGK